MLARRTVMAGLAGLPLAAILADARLAAEAAARLETVSITTKEGRHAAGALAVPATTPAPAILLIHEWWGLNDQIKSMAAELADQGYVALAADLYDGKVASDPDQAQALTKAMDPAKAVDILVSWIDWLKRHEGANGKVATIGWCFGGGWSLNASLAAPVDATVIYYGRVDRPADELKSLKGPVLGHFALKDQFINQQMVGGFEAAMKTAGKQLTVYWYDADHAFANPTGARYDKADAQLAWSRTLEFLKRQLG
jgi:carboxymethylenebutenolidase